ncbi:GntR family transcriptional regulator [Microvirga massiliensis]|uniref:GntR family transcriptional regulator n=1 Tax=Microvirga massiliensis TaxID=1033741 RepID=UPI00062BB013|nr:GntR family transcriptional regulator [Microvirga massiliensis]
MTNAIGAEASQATDGGRAPAGAPAAEIHRSLVTAITDHRLPPGTKLGEDRLAQIFRVSRARIREVLMWLSHERLVTLQPNRGAFVAEPTVRETQEICEARRVIEAATVATVARQADQPKLARLRGILEREAKAWETGDRFAAVRTSREFHLAIAELAGNSILAETLHNILSRNSLSIARYEGRGSPGCLCPEHFDILQAIERSDASSAAELMIRHLDHIEQRMNLIDSTEEIDLAAALGVEFEGQ